MFVQPFSLFSYFAGSTTPPITGTVIQARFEGANGSTSFVDDTGKTITNLGSATNSTGQAYYGNSALRTTGSTAGNIAWAHTSDQWLQGDFTIEFWIYPNVAYTDGSPRTFLVKRNTASGVPPFYFAYASAGSGVRVGFSLDGSSYGSTAAFIPAPLNTWTHVAACRSGTTLRYFRNGIQTSTGNLTLSGALFNSTANIGLGGDSGGATASVDAYFDNIRIVNGTALYTTTFTPTNFPGSVSPDTFASNVVLLMHFNNNSNPAGSQFIDTKGHAMTLVGSPALSATQSKFGGYSGQFTSTAYLTTPDHADFNLTGGDWTAEGWFYPTSTPGADTYILGQWGAASPDNSWIVAYGTSNAIKLNYGGSTQNFGTAALNTWHHFAIVRSGGVIKAYLNGVQGFATPPTYDVTNATSVLSIGGYSSGTGFTGFLDEFRITKGVARYTADFTAPTAPFPNV